MREKNNAILLFILLAVIAAGIVFGLLPFIKEYNETIAEERVYDALKEEEYVQIIHPSGADSADGFGAGSQPQDNAGEYDQLAIDFDALHAINPETIGWLYIPDTPIHYPVLYTEDTQKYISHNFYGEPSSSGALFLEGTQAFAPPSQNLVIYGHNMGRGKSTMFSSLIRYKDAAYFAKHNTVYFDTTYQPGVYKAFSVIHTKLNDGFAYTQKEFAHAEEFMKFIEQAQALSLHPSDVVVHPTDEILSLSTCDRSKYGADGRLVVLCVKIAD